MIEADPSDQLPGFVRRTPMMRLTGAELLWMLRGEIAAPIQLPDVGTIGNARAPTALAKLSDSHATAFPPVASKNPASGARDVAATRNQSGQLIRRIRFNH
jgi:hypothetical protein